MVRVSNETHSHYHHGDLAETLMEAALRHIAAEGTESLSLRALAREAGVSATAPYRHFPSKQCLFAALATRGFRELERATRAGMHPEMALEERFRAMGRAYVDYAVNNPTSYNLMFGSMLADFSDYPELERAGADCYSVVLEVLEELIEAREMDMTAVQLGGVIWAGVHGLASLLINKTAVTDADENQSSLHRRSLAYVARNPDKALEILFEHLLEP